MSPEDVVADVRASLPTREHATGYTFPQWDHETMWRVIDAYDAAQAKAAALQAQVTVLTDRNAELERLRDHPEPLGVVVDDEMARRYLDFVYKGREYSNLEVIEVQRQLTAALRGAKTVPLESVGQAKESTFPQWYHETLWRVIDAAQAQVAALRGRLERVKNCLPEQPTLLRGSDGELHEMLFADDVRAALTQETNT